MKRKRVIAEDRLDSLGELFFENLNAEKGRSAMAKGAGHDGCNHPEEIADVKATIKRRLAFIISAIGLVAFSLGSLVMVTVYAATTRADVNHLQLRESEDRGAAEKALEARQAEDRAIRTRIEENESENARQHGNLIRSTTAIETHLKVIADSSKRGRR